MSQVKNLPKFSSYATELVLVVLILVGASVPIDPVPLTVSVAVNALVELRLFTPVIF
jgi:hypothetical protein